MTWVTIEFEGHTYRLPVATAANGTWVGYRGRVRFVPKESRQAAEGIGEDEIRAPMTGKVIQIRVAAGDQVSSGTVLVVLEAMKMEYRLAAPHDGTVEAVHCREGELVDLGATLVTLLK
ncbi:MAG: acetyl-CoA carboxylase biotin carboxyl carrier protein subunit [Candidatus Zixiibacteriota bacterium]